MDAGLVWVFIFACCFPQGNFAVESLRFFIIGDNGGMDTAPYTTQQQITVAKQMRKKADLYQPDFIMELGDNFYDNGVKNVEDKRFQETFESVYTAKSLQIPWYIVAGNHDYGLNVSAQIAYSKISKRWNFPDFYYYLEFPFNKDGDTVGFVMMDTMIVCGTNLVSNQAKPSGPVDPVAAEKQWKFVEKLLSQSRSKYLFTAGHYPVYSAGIHGPTTCLVNTLLPLLLKYRANGHLSGHDHDLQVKSQSGWHTDYFVSGMAGRANISMPHIGWVPPHSLKFHGGYHTSEGFLYAEATSSNMTFTFMSGKGEHLYSTHVFPRA